MTTTSRFRRTHRSTWLLGLTWALLVVMTAGCSHDEGKRPMMTYQRAADTVEQLIRENVASPRPAPRLEPILKPGVKQAPCSGPNDDRETGNVMVEQDYYLRDIDPTLNDDILQQIRRYWSENGYRVFRETGSSATGPHEVVVKHPKNGFRVMFTTSQGVMSIFAQSNCVAGPKN